MVVRVYSQRADATVAESAHITLPINVSVQTLLPRSRDVLEVI